MKTFAFTRVAASALLLATAAFPLGCASPQLTLTSLKQNQCFCQGFTQAWSRSDDNGDTDVVLVDHATEQALGGQSPDAPVRQVMHIRVVWSPTRDMKAIVSNAAVKWYVIGSKPGDVLEYSGIAFVSLTPGEDGTTLKVQNATLTPSAHHGSLTDPLGPSRLDGSFIAKSDSQRVEQILSQIRAVTASNNTAAHPQVSSVDAAK